MKKYIGGAKLIQFNKLMEVPQNFYKNNGNQSWSPFFGFYDESSCYLGTWLKSDALDIKEELSKDGFEVKLRPRGSRKKYFEELGHPISSYDYDMPLKYATHAAIYITGEISDVRNHE